MQQHAGERADIVIAGGGFAGLALAIALRQGLGPDFTVVVADPALAGSPVDARASAIAAGARRLFETIGVWGAVAAEAQPILDMVVTDSRLGDAVKPVFLTFAGEVAPDEPFAHMVENRPLVEALVGKAREEGVVLRPCAVAAFEVAGERVVVRLADGAKIKAALLIAADGARLRSRERAPSAAISKAAFIFAPSASRTTTRSPATSKAATAHGRKTTPSSRALPTSASTSGRFSTMWANGSSGATSPAKVRKTGFTASPSRLSVTTMSRIGCASAATAPHTPMVSNSRRAPAAMAEARASTGLPASAGSATTTVKSGPSPWRNAIASASPAKPPPAITMSARSPACCCIVGSLLPRTYLARTAALQARRHNGAKLMSSAISEVLAILDLEPLEVNLFRGRSPQVGWQRVFGGQVIGQALVAACRTVEGRPT